MVPSAPTGPPPVPQGGVVPQGRFRLTSLESYEAAVPSQPTRSLYQISGNHVEYVFQVEGRAPETNSFDITTSEATMVKTRTCPGPAVQTDQYTATADGLIFFRASGSGTSVWRLAR